MGKGRQIQFLILHTTATPYLREVTRQDIERWHMSPKPQGRGWDRLGYADMIHLDGRIENLTPYNDDDIVDSDEITWGALGYNAIGRHVVYVGGLGKDGLPQDTRTDSQYIAMEQYVRETIAKYPHIKIGGHRDTFPDTDGSGQIEPYEWKKACPCFDVGEFLEQIGLPEYYMHYES